MILLCGYAFAYDGFFLRLSRKISPPSENIYRSFFLGSDPSNKCVISVRDQIGDVNFDGLAQHGINIVAGLEAHTRYNVCPPPLCLLYD